MENEILCSKCEAVIGEGDLYTHSPSKNGNWCAECTLKRAKENFAELKSLRASVALLTDEKSALRAAVTEAARLTTEPEVYRILLMAISADFDTNIREIAERSLGVVDALRTADGEVTDES